MTVRRILSTLSLAGFSVVALGAAGAALSTNSEMVVRQGFSAALQSAPTERVATAARRAPIAGSEDYWLTSDQPSGALPVIKAVSVGDQFIVSLDGKDIRLEVADVSDYAPQVTAIDTRSIQTRYLMVTARDTSNRFAEPVRFVVEVEQPAAGKLAKKAERAS